MPLSGRLSILLATAIAMHAQAQDPALNPIVLAGILNTPQHQWVFNHICVPKTALAGRSFTQGEFVDAYFVVSNLRWKVAAGNEL